MPGPPTIATRIRVILLWLLRAPDVRAVERYAQTALTLAPHRKVRLSLRPGLVPPQAALRSSQNAPTESWRQRRSLHRDLSPRSGSSRRAARESRRTDRP